MSKIFTKIDEDLISRDKYWHEDSELVELRLASLSLESDHYISSKFNIDAKQYEFVYVIYPGLTMVGVIVNQDWKTLVDPFYLNPNQQTNSIDFLGLEGITGAIPSSQNTVLLNDSSLIIKPGKIALSVMQQYLRQIKVSYDFRTKSPTDLHEDYLKMQEALKAEDDLAVQEYEKNRKRMDLDEGIEVNQELKVSEGVLTNSN